MNPNNSEGVRKPFLYAVWLIILVAIAGIVVFKRFIRPPSETAPDSVAAEPATTPEESQPTQSRPMRTARAADPGDPGQSTSAAPPAQPAPRPKPRATSMTSPSTTLALPPGVEPTPETRRLVSSLATLDLTAPLTAEAAATWKQNLGLLAQGGAASLPAIQEYLALNKDVNFESVAGGVGMLGSSSLRMSLIDALGNIAGPEALALSTQVLQSTTDPREIALLASNLNRQDPEQYREAVLAAARSAMAEAGAGRLTGKDIGPLFEVLRNYGGPNAVEDFQQAAGGQWKYYATIALANLPDGAGVPALVQMVADPASGARSGRVAAMQALAQLIPDHPDAREVLLEQSRQAAIPDATWINIAAALTGERFQIGSASTENNPNLRTWHLAYGNQNYYASPIALTPDQVQQRLVILDQFLSVNANNAFAAAALQEARSKLLARQAPVQ